MRSRDERKREKTTKRAGRRRKEPEIAEKQERRKDGTGVGNEIGKERLRKTGETSRSGVTEGGIEGKEEGEVERQKKGEVQEEGNGGELTEQNWGRRSAW